MSPIAFSFLVIIAGLGLSIFFGGLHFRRGTYPVALLCLGIACILVGVGWNMLILLEDSGRAIISSYTNHTEKVFWLPFVLSLGFFAAAAYVQSNVLDHRRRQAELDRAALAPAEQEVRRGLATTHPH